jgi:hypothetical protein
MLRIVVLLAVLAAALPGAAAASELIDRNATGLSLKVNDQGQALLTYTAAGRLKHVLVWGAIDARHPTAGVAQVKFRVDYSGGWGSFRKLVWKDFKNVCARYTGPPLAWQTTACTAPDGTYWAVQSWQRPLPDLGFTPWLAAQSAVELRISHWTGSNIAALEVHSDWVYGGRFEELFGRMTYLGQPVHGFKTTSTGVPLDTYGRNLYLDTLDSTYGQGWRRENGFVVHNPSGNFCYGFYPFKVVAYAHPGTLAAGATRGPGTGSQYRITVIGPGVTPDVTWQGPGLHPFDRANPADVALEEQMNALHDDVSSGDTLCKQH